MEGKAICPHCQAELLPLQLPEPAGWGMSPQWVCFNDDCPYFREGWDWMWENYEVKASYRYRVSSQSATKGSPLPVWSKDAMRDRILADGELAPERERKQDNDND